MNAPACSSPSATASFACFRSRQLISLRIVGILLAAGRGARFGGAKLLAPLPAASHGVGAGTAVGIASLRHLLTVVPEVIAVVRPGDSMLGGQLAEEGARVVECPGADSGMGASLAFGVAACADAQGWIVALADMPWIAPSTIQSVADALRAGAAIVAPSYHGERGHPVGFAEHFRDQLMGLAGDEGARTILAARKEVIHMVAVMDPGILRDVDSAADLRA